MELINGVLFHATGASSAALCYTPEKKVVGWSWQTYWLAQAFVCWLALPVIMAFVTIPQLTTVLHEAPSAAMINSFLLGMAYGVGGTAFGIAIRYVGFSLTYAIAVGISCVLGTLLPPLVHGTLIDVLKSNGASFLIFGIVLGALGIALCGMAGRNKEKDIETAQDTKSTFSLAKGLPLCLLAGILSALYGFSLDQGQPIADVAANIGHRLRGLLPSNVCLATSQKLRAPVLLRGWSFNILWTRFDRSSTGCEERQTRFCNCGKFASCQARTGRCFSGESLNLLQDLFFGGRWRELVYSAFAPAPVIAARTASSNSRGHSTDRNTVDCALRQRLKCDSRLGHFSESTSGSATKPSATVIAALSATSPRSAPPSS